MNKNETKTFFIAQCGDKYLYKWYESSFCSFVWYIEPTKFDTKEECLKAVGSAMGNSEKPNSNVIIKELKETIITDVVSEETL